MCIIIHLVTKVIWKYSNVYILGSVHIPGDVCNKTFSNTNNLKVLQHLHTGVGPCRCDVCNIAFSETARRYINVFVLWSVHFAVILVTKHSSYWNVWIYIDVYILGSVHMAVMWALKNLVTDVIWMYISVYILESIHIAVVCAVRCSVINVF
jgi:hypothetical protein